MSYQERRINYQSEERRKFLEHEWPQIAERIERLGLEIDELLGSKTNQEK